MKKNTLTFGLIAILIVAFVAYLFIPQKRPAIKKSVTAESYWFMLHRKSNRELLYRGISGDATRSVLIKTFPVKTGVPGKKPTPLPSLLKKEYWVLTEKLDAHDNTETGPYFLTLNVPFTEEEPFGPTPYLECNGQCNWELPGAFGLHGTGDDPTRLSTENPGSSGCIRHSNEDIAYLYNLLDLTQEVRYYIQDI
jgi:hypothetical protein